MREVPTFATTLNAGFVAPCRPTENAAALLEVRVRVPVFEIVDVEVKAQVKVTSPVIAKPPTRVTVSPD